jgi:quinol monooxygenase YgiN
MHVRVTRGSSDPAAYDQVVAISREIAVAVKRVPGCRSYVGAANRATGAIVAISTWESAEAVGFSRDVLGDVVPRLSALGVRLEPAEIYEVVVEA